MRYNRGMRWGVARLKMEYTFRSEVIDRDFLTDISKGAEDFEDFADECSVRSARFFLKPEGEDEVVFENAGDFLLGCSAYGLRVVFVWRGFEFFHMLDIYRFFENPGKYEVITTERDQNGFYKGRNKEAYIEKSGANGQRFSCTFWTRSARIKGNRHKRLRPSQFVNLDNIIVCGEDAARDTFGVTADGLEGIEEVVKAFNKECAAAFIPLIGEKKLNSETIGGLAKKALCDCLGGVRAVKKHGELFPAQYRFLSRARLMRGGINYINPKIKGERLSGVFGYDVNSEYLKVLSEMPRLGKLEKSSFEEYEADRTEEYTYILFFDDLEISKKPGALECFKTRKGDTSSGGIQATPGEPMAFFHEEIEELSFSYDFNHWHIYAVLKARREAEPGFRLFAETWFSKKKEAKAQGRKGEELIAKFIINSAIGKLSQKKIYGICVHEPVTGGGRVQRIIKLHQTPPTPEEIAKECGALDYVQGSYVTALARTFWMRTARTIAGGEPPEDIFLYGDTDSFYLRRPVPANMIGPELGSLKEECANGTAVFLANKVYGFRDEKGRNEIHAAGVRKEDLKRFAAEEGKDPFELLKFGQVIPTRLNVIIDGGRIDLYMRRAISAGPIKAREGRIFGTGAGGFFEL